MDTLIRRRDHLLKRVEQPWQPDWKRDFDAQEAAALTWALEVLRDSVLEDEVA